MHVVGTAGHVDHGKSALVRALTGIDPDRLEEEKRRGLTIDLGFAWFKLPSGREVGVVDVPGHERFIKNMLAGVGAINVTLFVVAANEGWKPQSQEHLDILDLLGVSNAVIALTKSDAVSNDDLEAVRAQVVRRVTGTSLAGAPIVAVSVVTGDGLTQLVGELERILESAPPASDRGRPRMWLDRIFTMRGSGTVVTGTLIDGSLTRDMAIEILPGKLEARIRSIQSHQRQVDAIGPGNRTALNLVGLEKAQLERGDAVTRAGQWKTTGKVAAEIRLLPHLKHDPTEKGAFKFYLGSAEVEAEIRFMGGDTPEFALISLGREIVADLGDRFVLRDAGRRETLGGGTVIDPFVDRAAKRSQAMQERLRSLGGQGRERYLQQVAEERGFLDFSEVEMLTGLDEEAARRILKEAILTDRIAITRTTFESVSPQIRDLVKAHQAAAPLDPGLDRSSIRAAISLPDHVIDAVIQEMATAGDLVLEATAVRTPDHTPQTDTGEAAELLDLLSQGGASPPTIPELGEQFDRKLIQALIRSGRIEQISNDIVYPVSTLAEIRNKVAEEIETVGPITVARFRDLAGTTRKYAVPLLEFLDRTGFTRRAGDVRVLGPRAQD